MFSFLALRSLRPLSPGRPLRRQRLRRLKAESLENRRVLAGVIDTCVPLAEAVLPEVPAEESVVPPFGAEVKRDSFDQKARPFKITGGGPPLNGLPLVPGLTLPFISTGNATGLGKFTGEGTFTLGSLAFDETGAVSGTFGGTFVFVAANGDELATTFGDGLSATFTGQLSADGSSVDNVEFDAFFSPDQANSSGRFAEVVGGGWRMIAKADSIGLIPNSPVSAPFPFTWSGEGTLDFAAKAK